MNPYMIKFLKKAETEFKNLDNNLFLKVSKVLTKLSQNPIAYSKPLGQKMNLDLTGLRKAYVDNKRIRIVFMILESRLIIVVISINKRDKGKVYHLTQDRIDMYQSLFDKLKNPAQTLDEIFKELS
ncbi:MAG: addiction module toxin RelE [Clostridia bacterium]|nr:addiction module toxin RelE [Clostridia bacterium]